MTRQELDKKFKEIASYAEQLKTNAVKEYVLSNNPYKIGDVIEDHIGKIQIDKITISISTQSCYYYGVELKKNGMPNKKQNTRCVWQKNIID